MGADWFRVSAEARILYEQADAYLGYSLSRLCFEGPAEDLNRTEITQPAIFVTSLCGWTVARAREPAPPAYVAGHSVGEFAALVAAGALSFEDGLRLVARRGQLMAEAGALAPGGMLALLGATSETAAALCAEAVAATDATVAVANDNCPGQVVVSGAQRALEAVVARARAHAIRRCVPLAVNIAPHSPLMAAAQGAFAALLETVTFAPPVTPVVFNALAAPATGTESMRQALARQLISPVRWRESLLWMSAQRVTRFVEVGPKNVLTGFVRRTLPEAQAEACDAGV